MLGRTGVKVSPLCLGAMMFGKWGNPDHDDIVRIIHPALCRRPISSFEVTATVRPRSPAATAEAAAARRLIGVTMNRRVKNTAVQTTARSKSELTTRVWIPSSANRRISRLLAMYRDSRWCHRSVRILSSIRAYLSKLSSEVANVRGLGFETSL